MKQRPTKRDRLPESHKAPSVGRSLRDTTLADCEEGILDLVPASLWVEDFSEVKRRLDHLRAAGVVDLRKHLDKRPQEVLRLARMVRIVWVNEATLELYGARDRSMLEESLGVIFSKESYDAFKEEIIALAEGQKRFVRETVNVTLRGQKIHILLQVKVDGSHDDLSRVYVSVTDISPCKHTEEELRKAETMYRQAFESSAIPMIMLDSGTGIIVDANSAVQQVLGIPVESSLGTHISQYCPADHKERCAEVLHRMMKRNQTVVESLNLCRKDGTEVCVVVTARTIRTPDDTYALLAFGPAGTEAFPWDRRAKTDRRASSAVQQRLSERERLVLTLIVAGHTNKVVAQRLGISVKTVESHRLRIMQKLDVHKATDLVRVALSSGILG